MRILRPTALIVAFTTTTTREGELMEEMPSVVALPFSIGNSPCDNPLEITCLKLITDTAGLLSDPMAADLPPERQEEVEVVVAMEEGGGGDELEVRAFPGSHDDDDDTVSVEPEPIESSFSAVSNCSSIDSVTGELLALDTGMPTSVDAAKNIATCVEIVAEPTLAELRVNVLTVVAGDFNMEVPALGESGIQVSRVSGSIGRCVSLTDYVPLWGCISICGGRPEMEDAVVSVPRFFEIPLQMPTGDRVIDGLNQCLIQLPAHFFGVYDGHGGAQVANYCRDRIHLALIEEINHLKRDLGGNNGVDWQKHWETAFIRCFQKVDDEVGGSVSTGIVGSTADSCGGGSSHPSSAPSVPVAPETVGSTAVVAVICSSHIIVANCGDSRAVLCRGKQPVPLSVDHKPNREDEYARIEAEGGRIIQWYGHRVFGVLAMSRSIGTCISSPDGITNEERKSRSKIGCTVIIVF